MSMMSLFTHKSKGKKFTWLTTILERKVKELLKFLEQKIRQLFLPVSSQKGRILF